MEQLTFGLIVLDPDKYRIQSMQKMRKCLCCSRTFQSAGPGNRFCNICKDRDVWKSSVHEYSSAASF